MKLPPPPRVCRRVCPPPQCSGGTPQPGLLPRCRTAPLTARRCKPAAPGDGRTRTAARQPPRARPHLTPAQGAARGPARPGSPPPPSPRRLLPVGALRIVKLPGHGLAHRHRPVIHDDDGGGLQAGRQAGRRPAGRPTRGAAGARAAPYGAGRGTKSIESEGGRTTKAGGSRLRPRPLLRFGARGLAAKGLTSVLP